MSAGRALTPSFVMDLESRMRVESESEYTRFKDNAWWQRFARVRTSTGRRELITWLLSTAQIKDQGDGGNTRFDDLVSVITEYEHKFAGTSLQLRRSQLTDTDGGGMDLAAQWSTDIGAYMAYWPQKQVTDIFKNGHTASRYTAYTQKAFFAVDHPNNPFKSSAGTYANLHSTAGGTTSYPIDDSVTLDVALQNLGKLFGKLAEMKMPNGEDPRFLRPETLLVPPRLFPRAVQLTDAKFLAQASTGGAGSADVKAVIQALGYATPVMADELAGFESDTTYFLGCKQLASSKLGGIIFSEREAFQVLYYGLVDDAELARMDVLEWQVRGRNAVAPGHPYLIHKIKAA